MVRVARNVVRDFGASAAAKTGVDALAKCSERNAERDTHRVLVKRMKLSLPVPIAKLGRKKKLSHAILRLRDWFSFLLSQRCWHVLTGLLKPNAERETAILSEFWEKYRLTKPSHPVFELEKSGAIQLSRCAPVLWHGDEGRGRRRQPFLVTSWHGLLGRGVRAGLAAQKKAGVKQSWLKLKPNFIGHAYTHRYLQAALPKAIFEEEAVFDALLEQCAEEANFMCTTGVLNPHDKQQYWAMTLGVTGDWQFLFKSAKMTRSYNNVQKKAHEANSAAGICHLCYAGKSGLAFEQFQTRQPSWLSTFCTDEPFEQPSPLTTLPHPQGQMPTIFRYDLWHSYHLGVGKAFCGSVIALMSQHQQYAERSKDKRMALLSADYMEWCRCNSRPAIVTKISKELIGWESNSDFPFGGWFKGALTTTIGSFIEAKLCSPDSPFSGDEFLKLCAEAVAAINTSLTGLYESDVFMEAARAKELGEHGLKFLRRYGSLAAKANRNRQTLVSILPKMHSLHHIFLQDLVLAAGSSAWVLNPLCFSVQVSEDMIGKLSRLSRRVHPSKCAERCIQRHLQLAYAQYVKEGYLVQAEGVSK